MLTSLPVEVSCAVVVPVRIWKGLGLGRRGRWEPLTLRATVSSPSPCADFSLMTPINDLHTADPLNLAKGERLMRCKISSVYRLLDLYGWAQLSDTYVTVRRGSWSGVGHCVWPPQNPKGELLTVGMDMALLVAFGQNAEPFQGF